MTIGDERFVAIVGLTSHSESDELHVPFQPTRV
jgi:hypothetical protein